VSLETILLTIGAVAVAAWPGLAGLVKRIPLVVPKPAPQPPAPTAGVAYQEAMLALAVVRTRLVQTDGLTDAAAKAVATITQELVAGSDK
jgi:hypothetical protein